MTSAERRCARLVQQVVCERDRVCQRCGATPICGHHFWSRRHHGTAFDPQALLGLCVECHQWAHTSPEMAKILLRTILGDERYTWIEALSKSICKLNEADFRDIAEGLKQTLEEMEWKG